jgi:ribonucleoside-diphosphate reductase alpha chain
MTAHDVTPEWHIQMQAAFQDFTDSAISKTCNFANDATEDYVEQIYRYAYQLGCKGVTVYRDGARENQVLSTGSTAKKVQESAGAGAGKDALVEALGRIAELDTELHLTRERLHDVEAENLQRRAKRSRPDLLKGSTRRIESPLGTMYVTITEDDKGQPFEVFMSLGKAGGALMADVEAIGRLISLALRSGVPLPEIYRQLRGISSDRAVGLGPNKVMSVPDAIGIAIEKWMQDKQGVQQDLLDSTPASAPAATEVVRGAVGDAALRAARGPDQDFIGACPDCGSQLAFIEGCAKCHVCGFSECG